MSDIAAEAILAIICQRKRCSIKRKITQPIYFETERFNPRYIRILLERKWIVAKGPNWIPTFGGFEHYELRNSMRTPVPQDWFLPFCGYNTVDSEMSYGVHPSDVEVVS